jgi:hypothetical protein
MLSIVASQADLPNDHFVRKERLPGQDNLSWLQSVPSLAEHVELLLLGGSGPGDFRLRIAQAHARHDLSPSHWSHIALLEPRQSSIASTGVVEVSLEPLHGFGFPPRANALQRAELERYADPRRHPNIALVQVPCQWAAIQLQLERLSKQRSAVDLPELVVAWLAFIWGVGKTGNPLLEGRGVPSAVLIETVLGAVGLDLSPGSVERASCPELVWQAAKWWQEFYAATDKSLSGAYFTPHELVEMGAG